MDTLKERDKIEVMKKLKYDTYWTLIVVGWAFALAFLIIIIASC